MPTRVAWLLFHCALLCALILLVGSLEHVRGRALGPRLDWQPYVALIALMLACSSQGTTAFSGRSRSLLERARILSVALLLWPLLVEVTGGDIQRKRVVLLMATGAGYVIAGATPIQAFLRRLGRTRRDAAAVIVALALGGAGLWFLRDHPESVHVDRSRVGRDLNVLLISVDTTRADALGCYGENRSTTPAIDRLASEGVLFEAAIAQAPHTHSSMASLLTSKYPIEHHSVALDPPLDRGQRTLAEVLWRAGYTTAAFLDNPWLRPEFGFDTGYDEFHEHAEVPGVLAWLDENRQERFFLHVHFLHPHGSYEPRSPWIDELSPSYEGPWESVSTELLERWETPGTSGLRADDLARIEALYASEVAAMDSDIARILEHVDQLGLREETLVVFVADHGEEFLDHGAMNHAHTLFDELVHVPLIMRLRGRLSRGLREQQQVELIDVLPTILDLVDVPTPGEARGRSLAGLIEAGEDPTVTPSGIAVSQRYAIKDRHLISARDGRWKLHVSTARTGEDSFLDWSVDAPPGREFSRRNRYRLYDLEADPGELDDCFAEQPEVARRLIDALTQWRIANDPGIPLDARRASVSGGMSAKAFRDLRALGYLGGD